MTLAFVIYKTYYHTDMYNAYPEEAKGFDRIWFYTIEEDVSLQIEEDA